MTSTRVRDVLDGGRHAGRIEDVGVQRRVGQGDDLHPGHVRRRDVDQAVRGSAVGLVAPAVGDGPDGLDAERGRDVAGDGVGIDQQDRLALARLER